MYTIPHEIWNDWSPYGTGFYNELVVPELVRELDAVGMTTQADRLRGYWERKVKLFASGQHDLFRSEYPFDSTGFESTHAMAKYALQHADEPKNPSQNRLGEGDSPQFCCADSAKIGTVPGGFV